MWQVRSLARNDTIVANALSEGITVLFERRQGAPLYLAIRLEGSEPRVFNKTHLPIITVDGEQVLDLKEQMPTLTDQDRGFLRDRFIGARIWSGTDRILYPHFTISKFLKGKT
jgi:hypothetical protein